MTTQDLSEIYAKLGIDTHQLGCVMLEVDKLEVHDLVPEDELYFSENIEYAQGIVSEWGLPHVTLLYGFMQNAQDWKEHIDTLLEGVDLSNVIIESVDTFENMDEETPYSYYVAKVKPTEDLLAAHANLQKLPHIDSYPDYIPHITLFYAKRNDELKPQLLDELNERFAGKKIVTKELVYD